jgi:hypothetical protein
LALASYIILADLFHRFIYDSFGSIAEMIGVLFILNFDSEMCGTLLGAMPSLGQCSLAKLGVIHYCVLPFS